MLKNADRLLKKLSGLSMEQAGAECVLTGAQVARDAAVSLCPVDTGRLRSGIGLQAQGLTSRVTADCGYAAAVEHGTTRAPARPFMQPAAERARAELVRAAEEIVRRRLSG